MLRSIAILTVLAVLLTGCATGGGFNLVGEDRIQNPLGDLKTFARKDATAALARAEKAKDAGAPYRARCYRTMLKYLPETPVAAEPVAPVAGLIDAFELAAEKVAESQSGGGLLKVPEDLQADCGYLVDELKRFALRAGAKFAPVPGLGSVGGVLLR